MQEKIYVVTMEKEHHLYNGGSNSEYKVVGLYSISSNNLSMLMGKIMKEFLKVEKPDEINRYEADAPYRRLLDYRKDFQLKTVKILAKDFEIKTPSRAANLGRK